MQSADPILFISLGKSRDQAGILCHRAKAWLPKELWSLLKKQILVALLQPGYYGRQASGASTVVAVGCSTCVAANTEDRTLPASPQTTARRAMLSFSIFMQTEEEPLLLSPRLLPEAAGICLKHSASWKHEAMTQAARIQLDSMGNGGISQVRMRLGSLRLGFSGRSRQTEVDVFF
jgi:hypothetical protein